MKIIKYLIFGLLLFFIGGCSNVSISTPHDFALDVAEGNIVGIDSQVYSAHNPDVDNSGSQEDIWEGGGLFTYLDTAETYEITSTDSDDTLGGSGANTLLVVGLNSTYDFVSELIIMDGTNDVTTVNSYLRPRVFNVLTAGSSQYNEGTITATSSSTAALQLQMDATESVSKNSHFTVPAGHTAYLRQVTFSTTKTGGQDPIVEFKGKRTIGTINNSAWIQTFDVKIDTSVNDHLILDQPLFNDISEKSDFRIEVTSTHDNVDVNTRLYWYFVEN